MSNCSTEIPGLVAKAQAVYRAREEADKEHAKGELRRASAGFAKQTGASIDTINEVLEPIVAGQGEVTAIDKDGEQERPYYVANFITDRAKSRLLALVPDGVPVDTLSNDYPMALPEDQLKINLVDPVGGEVSRAKLERYHIPENAVGANMQIV